ncbi:superoxide dismutase family protein [Ancylobacter sp. MQZ15Z-1]|uniref:Superoxide dismutase [Cu-Zn] n=1 Tax=Ancylobacter mangrovi TaxID=2972472 RepID=A0A9X2T0U1_9HYPH|nr:superoxide dismutase family protein [Ancylobacter mangrovi]MCS0494002.1 superoxide dismutase family protein [Ancylobacter mangrovi]
MGRLPFAVAALCLAAAPGFAQTPKPAARATATATASIINTEGAQIGTATLRQTLHGVLIAVEVSGLPQGEHGFHIHQTGRCDPKDGFKTAGGHYAPRQKRHGLMDPDGPHAGDMPNQLVGAAGTMSVQVLDTAVTLEPGKATLFDDDGSAIVIHSGPDDYVSQPAGNAGDRIACGVIKKS